MYATEMCINININKEHSVQHVYLYTQINGAHFVEIFVYVYQRLRMIFYGGTHI